MSRENVEAVLAVFESVNERDFARVLDAYAEHVVLAFHGDVMRGDGAVGKQAVGEWFGDWFRNFDRDYRFEINDTRDFGDQVFVVATHHGRGRASGVPIEQESSWIFTVEDGKVVRLDGYPERGEALEAVGLRE